MSTSYGESEGNERSCQNLFIQLGDPIASGELLEIVRKERLAGVWKTGLSFFLETEGPLEVVTLAAPDFFRSDGEMTKPVEAGDVFGVVHPVSVEMCKLWWNLMRRSEPSVAFDKTLGFRVTGKCEQLQAFGSPLGDATMVDGQPGKICLRG